MSEHSSQDIKEGLEEMIMDQIESGVWKLYAAECDYGDGVTLDGLIVCGVPYGVKIDVWKREAE